LNDCLTAFELNSENMKARHIRKLRKKILSPDYNRKRYEELLDCLKDWRNFAEFKCNSFFVGYEQAQYNIAIHNKNVPRLEKKAEWYRKRLENVPIKYRPL